MGLSQIQRTLLAKAKSLGGGSQGIALDDEQCTGLLALALGDLSLLNHFPELPATPTDFFDVYPLEQLRIQGLDFLVLFERSLELDNNVDTYFNCLATLHKSRLKYERILATQPLPTIDQIGPRVLLQYGSFSLPALTSLLLWRKWMYDIDNRAAQETGYLFEPIIASAVGGTPASASRSPIRRRADRAKGRQVDCIIDKRAYEIKLRVTIAASGQGRWQEELDFAEDCRLSGYTPVLVVLDPTHNPKIDELRRAYRNADGEDYVGEEAWKHLEATAGVTMALFLERYVRRPLDALMASVPPDLPELTLAMSADAVVFRVGADEYRVPRGQPDPSLVEEPSAIVPDLDDGLPGLP